MPPSDISRTKPLVRLVLNQIGRRLTEELETKNRRHRLLLMLDEFPALGRLDFFETALAFMAGYGLKSFLIAQSLNQIEKAYGPNNSILDNCHVRVSFATNDERTAKRVSDALGIATELRAMKNYAGHRLSPWLGHLMISRQETARPLLTAGEVMQLPPTDELVLVSACHPIRAKKARYYEDRRLKTRVLPPPSLTTASEGTSGGRPNTGAETGAISRFQRQSRMRLGRSPALSPIRIPTTAASGVSRCCLTTKRSWPRSRSPAQSLLSSMMNLTMTQPVPEHCGSASAQWRDRPRSIRMMAFRSKGAPRKERLSVYLDPHVMRSLIDYADRRGKSKSLIAEAAIASFLSPDAAERQEATLARRLDRLVRQTERLERDVGIAVETLALFVRFWLTATPALPEQAQAAARAKGAERYHAFIEALGRRLSKGPTLLREVSVDVAAASELDPSAKPVDDTRES